MGGNVVVPLTMLAGGAALVYVGITNPAGGAFAGLGNLIRGVPNTPATVSTVAADLAGLAGSPATGGAAPASFTATSADARRAEVLAQAQTWLGVPYVFGGNSRSGIDCSGFTLQVFATVGVHLPRVSYLQALRGRRTSNPQPGDLVAFGRPVHHVGIYLGNGQLVNAPHTGTEVRVEPVWNTEPVQYRDLLSGSSTRTRKARKPRRHKPATHGVAT